MCNVFLNRKGVLLVDFWPRGGSVNSAMCCETLNKLHYAIQNKRHCMLSRGWFCFVTMSINTWLKYQC
ncbi:hypothetical protein X975_23431, partial [Stegodyphus mimosarum]